MKREQLSTPVQSQALQSVCVWKGSSEEMRHTYMKSAQEGGTLICHTKLAESERAVQRRERVTISPFPTLATFTASSSNTQSSSHLASPCLAHAQHF